MISFADLIGKPYAIDGIGPDFYGCWGLARTVAARVGKPLPYFPVPDELGKRNGLFVHVRDGGDFIEVKFAEPWAIASFLIKGGDDGKLHWHVGTVLQDRVQFIHTIKKGGVCISRLSDPLWDLLFEGFYRYGGDYQNNTDQ